MLAVFFPCKFFDSQFAHSGFVVSLASESVETSCYSVQTTCYSMLSDSVHSVSCYVRWFGNLVFAEPVYDLKRTTYGERIRKYSIIRQLWRSILYVHLY